MYVWMLKKEKSCILYKVFYWTMRFWTWRLLSSHPEGECTCLGSWSYSTLSHTGTLRRDLMQTTPCREIPSNHALDFSPFGYFKNTILRVEVVARIRFKIHHGSSVGEVYYYYCSWFAILLESCPAICQWPSRSIHPCTEECRTCHCTTCSHCRRQQYG